MKQHVDNPESECPLFSLRVADFAALEMMTLPSKHTVLFVAADTSEVSTETIARVAQRLLAQGVIWICAWGPDCERVHDIFDEVHAGDGTLEPSFTLMSTWHDNDSLEVALRFFVENAFPLDHEIPNTSYVAVTVNNDDWADTVDKALSDLPTFLSSNAAIE